MSGTVSNVDCPLVPRYQRRNGGIILLPVGGRKPNSAKIAMPVSYARSSRWIIFKHEWVAFHHWRHHQLMMKKYCQETGFAPSADRCLQSNVRVNAVWCHAMNTALFPAISGNQCWRVSGTRYASDTGDSGAVRQNIHSWLFSIFSIVPFGTTVWLLKYYPGIKFHQIKLKVTIAHVLLKIEQSTYAPFIYLQLCIGSVAVKCKTGL
jgi:hypothetical protein